MRLNCDAVVAEGNGSPIFCNRNVEADFRVGFIEVTVFDSVGNKVSENLRNPPLVIEKSNAINGHRSPNLLGSFQVTQVDERLIYQFLKINGLNDDVKLQIFRMAEYIGDEMIQLVHLVPNYTEVVSKVIVVARK